MKVINKSIECICNFDKDGKLRPIRIRLKAEDGSNQAIDINTVLHMEELKVTGSKDKVRKYICECVVNDVKKIVELKFDLLSTTWLLYRI